MADLISIFLIYLFLFSANPLSVSANYAGGCVSVAQTSVQPQLDGESLIKEHALVPNLVYKDHVCLSDRNSLIHTFISCLSADEIL